MIEVVAILAGQAACFWIGVQEGRKRRGNEIAKVAQEAVDEWFPNGVPPEVARRDPVALLVLKVLEPLTKLKSD